MLFRKTFEILHCAMAFLVLLNKFCSNFLPLIRNSAQRKNQSYMVFLRCKLTY